MPRTPQDVTEAELAVLQVLWKEGPATIRVITDQLYPDGRNSHYATVQKLLERLEDKEFVRRDRTASIHVFSAAVNRDELIGRKLQNVAAQLCGGSLAPLLTNLVQNSKLSARDRKHLRSLIEELDPSGKSRRRPD
jgi:BlaI family transcriptional regulator, penicillinase repressor